MNTSIYKLLLLVPFRVVFSVKTSYSNSGVHKGNNMTTNAFISHKPQPSLTSDIFKNMKSIKSEENKSPIEPIPYERGYVSPITPGAFKYCGHTLDGGLEPINNYVLILKSTLHDVTQGGVYIGTKPNQEFIGRVMAVGPGKLHENTGRIIPVSVKAGDMVLFEPPEEESVITYKTEKCVLITDDRIYARIVPTESPQHSSLAAERVAPLSDRIFVRIIDTPNKTESGLVIARSEERKENVIRGEVVSIGPGSYKDDGSLNVIRNLKVGDHILFSDNTADGGEFSCNKKQHAFVRYRAILAKL